MFSPFSLLETTCSILFGFIRLFYIVICGHRRVPDPSSSKVHCQTLADEERGSYEDEHSGPENLDERSTDENASEVAGPDDVDEEAGPGNFESEVKDATDSHVLTVTLTRDNCL